eukprot:5159311-Pyramimonas_sp.AAC.1
MALAVAPRTFLLTNFTRVPLLPMIDVPEVVFKRDSPYGCATVRMIRGVEVSGTAFWHDSGTSRRSSQVYPWRWNAENNVLACFGVFKRMSSNEAGPSVEMNRCWGL